MVSSKQNAMAKRLKALCKPGTPLILTNVYDAPTAAIVASYPSTTALATASYAIAATLGLDDNDLSKEDNITRIRQIATVAAKADLPLTADLQDGYEDLADTVFQVIRAGAVGCNIEDTKCHVSAMRTQDEAVARISLTLKAAEAAGVPDFVVNARTDTLCHEGTVADAIERGKAYIAAGAVTVYVLGGPRGVSKSEVAELVRTLDGMVNVRLKLAPGYLRVPELAELGVARLSIGPDLYFKAMEGFKHALETTLSAC